MFVKGRKIFGHFRSQALGSHPPPPPPENSKTRLGQGPGQFSIGLSDRTIKLKCSADCIRQVNMKTMMAGTELGG